MNPTLRRYANRWLRPWPAGVAAVIIVAAALIVSNSLSGFITDMFSSGGQPSRPVAQPTFRAGSAPQAVCGDQGLLAGPATAPSRRDRGAGRRQLAGELRAAGQDVLVRAGGAHARVRPVLADRAGGPGHLHRRARRRARRQGAQRLRLQRARVARHDQLPHRAELRRPGGQPEPGRGQPRLRAVLDHRSLDTARQRGRGHHARQPQQAVLQLPRRQPAVRIQRLRARRHHRPDGRPQRDLRQRHLQLGSPPGGLRLHGRRQVLGCRGRGRHQQLDQGQPQRRPVGRYQ